jgi:hypothetical protein
MLKKRERKGEEVKARGGSKGEGGEVKAKGRKNVESYPSFSHLDGPRLLSSRPCTNRRRHLSASARNLRTYCTKTAQIEES